MKFLQTGDWHLGKTFFEQPLIDDQQHFLAQITEELQRACTAGSPYDALIVPGDVYDRAVPPPEAVSLLSTFLTGTNHAFPRLHIFLLAGNHDSAERLSFAKDILSAQRIHICTDCSTFTEPVFVADAEVYQLPFLTPGCIRAGNSGSADLFQAPLRGQQELLDAAVEQIVRARGKRAGAAAAPDAGVLDSDTPAVLCAHLFAAGSRRSESERIPVGTAEQVAADSFKGFAYTALGHLHSCQQAGNHVWYSGAPLCYSFAESQEDKYMLSVSVSAGAEPDVQKIPVHPLHRCTILKAPFSELLSGSAFDHARDDYVQAVCTDRAPVENPIARLRQRFPRILSFTYAQDGAAGGSSTTLSERRELLAEHSGHSAEDIFRAFHKDIYGGSGTDDAGAALEAETALFRSYAARIQGGMQ